MVLVTSHSLINVFYEEIFNMVRLSIPNHVLEPSIHAQLLCFMFILLKCYLSSEYSINAFY